MLSGSHDALLRLWDWQRNLLSFARTHKLDLGSGISPNGQMVASGSVIKPCGSGMCEMVSAAKHCRDIRVWFARSVSAQWTHVASGSSDQTVRSGMCKMAPVRTYRTYGWGLGSRVAQMDTPLRVAAVIKPCGSGMCKMAPASNLTGHTSWVGQSRLAMDTPLRWQQ